MMDNRNISDTPRDRIEGDFLDARLRESAGYEAPWNISANRNRQNRRSPGFVSAGWQNLSAAEDSGEERLDAEMRGEERGCARVNCLSGLPLAMVYMPDQEWRNLYGMEEALCHGTLFSELDFPFCMGCAR